MGEYFKGLVDHRGMPIEKAELTIEQAPIKGRGVRRPHGEHPAAGLTPGRLARLLRDSIESDPERYLELAEDMEERDPHYASVMGTRKGQVAALDITVKAASDSAEDVADADLVREALARDSFEDELIDILDAIGKGFSATEIHWDTSEGQWMPRALEWRDPRWFTFDRNDGETLLLRDDGANLELKPYKWIVHRAKAKSGLTIRGGLARGAAWPFLFKSFTIKDWAIFCEAYGQPLRLGKYDPSASEADKDTLLRAVANIGADYAAIVPEGMAVEFIKADIAGSHTLYEDRADWLDRQISKLVLGQTGTTDSQAGSGYAQSKVQDGVRGDIERRDAKQLSATLNRDFVRPLVDLNRGRRRKYPTVKIGGEEGEDLDKLMERTEKFVRLGGKVGMSTVRDKLGYPDPDENEELLAVQSPALLPAPGVARRAVPPPVAATLVAAALDPIAAGAHEATQDDWMEMVDPIVDGLEDEIANASTVEEVRAILARRADELDIDRLAEMLARGSFSARVSGEAEEPLD